MEIINVLLEITIYSVVIFAATVILKKCYKSKMSPFLHYVVWLVLIVRLMLPITVQSPVHLFTLPAGHPAGVSIDSDTQQNTAYAAERLPQTTAVADTQNATGAVQKPAQNPDIKQAETPVPAQKYAVLQPCDIAVTVWLCGTAGFVLYLVLLYCVLRRRLYKNTAPPPQKLFELLDQTKKELGIKAKIKLVCQYEYGTPALMFPNTIIMPVNALVAMSDAQICFALRHELMHYRRGDQLINILLSLLNAVYWFNPIVWLAMRLIHADMETACDSDVVKRLSADERKNYACLIVGLFSQPQCQSLALGMAQGDAKKVAEQRVRGIFMNSRSPKKVKLVSAILAALLIATCFTTACQPTPQKAFVQSKNNDSVQKAIESTAAGAPAPAVKHTFSAPKTWKGEVHDTNKKIDINVDANVIVPTDTWGLYQLIPKTADLAFYETVLKALIGDKEIYGQDTYLSKDEIQKQIIQVKLEMEREQKRGENPEQIKKQESAEKAGGKVPEGLTFVDVSEQYKARLSRLEAAFAVAPDKKTDKRVAIDLATLLGDHPTAPDVNEDALEFGMKSIRLLNSGGVEIHALADTGKSQPAQISLVKFNGTVDIRVWNAGEGNIGGFGGREPLKEEPFKANITRDKAEELARQTVKQMGFGYLDIAAVHKISIYDKPRMDDDKMPECYAFTFTRSLDGVSATYAYADGIEDKESESQYTASWRPTEVLLGVDASGIVYAEVNVPQSDIKKLASGIELKNFDAIMEIFNRQAAIEGCFSTIGMQELVVGRSIDVDEIRLGYMPTIWKDHPDQIIFVPVWDFFGSEATKFDENYKDKAHSDLYSALDKNYQFHTDLDNQAILTINALDGTIMKRDSGPD